MRFTRGTGIPYLWKSVPYAIEPVIHQQRVFYSFGYNRAELVCVGSLVVFTILVMFFSAYALVTQGMSLAASIPGGFLTLTVFVLLLSVFVVITIWAVRVIRRRSQVCIDVDSGTAQIQYNFRRNSSISPAAIIVQNAVIERDGPHSLEEKLLGKINASWVSLDVSLVAVLNRADFEIVGAFKTIDAAYDFAEVVRDETGLEVIDQELEVLRCVSGGRGFGLLSTDKRALRKRYRARPFERVE